MKWVPKMGWKVTIDEDEIWEGRSEVRYGTATGVLSTT
jgi:hypothetical protein